MTTAQSESTGRLAPVFIGLVIAIVLVALFVSSRLLFPGDGPPERLVFLVPPESVTCASELTSELEETHDELLVVLAADPALLTGEDELALVVVGPDDTETEAAVRGIDGWRKVDAGLGVDVFGLSELSIDGPRAAFAEQFTERCA